MIEWDKINEQCYSFVLKKSSRKITKFYDRIMVKSGINSTQFNLMVEIHTLGKLNLSAVANHMGMDRTTLTRNMKTLVKNGFVSAYVCKDKRFKKHSLTPGGVKAIEACYPLWEKAQEEWGNKNDL